MTETQIIACYFGETDENGNLKPDTWERPGSGTLSQSEQYRQFLWLGCGIVEKRTADRLVRERAAEMRERRKGQRK